MGFDETDTSIAKTRLGPVLFKSDNSRATVPVPGYNPDIVKESMFDIIVDEAGGRLHIFYQDLTNKAYCVVRPLTKEETMRLQNVQKVEFVAQKNT